MRLISLNESNLMDITDYVWPRRAGKLENRRYSPSSLDGKTGSVYYGESKYTSCLMELRRKSNLKNDDPYCWVRLAIDSTLYEGGWYNLCSEHYFDDLPRTYGTFDNFVEAIERVSQYLTQFDKYYVELDKIGRNYAKNDDRYKYDDISGIDYLLNKEQMFNSRYKDVSSLVNKIDSLFDKCSRDVKRILGAR